MASATSPVVASKASRSCGKRTAIAPPPNGPRKPPTYRGKVAEDSARRTAGRLGGARRACGEALRISRMPGPLLAVDAPSLLYRAFYALPKTITDDEGTPVNALLGVSNLVLQAVEKHAPRAVVLCFGEEAAHYRVELYPTYHADRIEMPEELVPPVGATRRLLRRLRLDGAAPRDARGRRPPRRPRRGRDAGRRAGAALHRRPRHVPVRLRRRHGPVAGGQGRDRAHRAGRGAQALRRAPRPGARLHRPARRPVRRAARRQGDRREDRPRAAQRARHPRRPARRCP